MKNLKIIAKETVDIEGIGFYTIGNYRKDMSENELSKYAELFEQYFLKSFSSRLLNIQIQKLVLTQKRYLVKTTL